MLCWFLLRHRHPLRRKFCIFLRKGTKREKFSFNRIVQATVARNLKFGTFRNSNGNDQKGQTSSLRPKGTPISKNFKLLICGSWYKRYSTDKMLFKFYYSNVMKIGVQRRKLVLLNMSCKFLHTKENLLVHF